MRVCVLVGCMDACNVSACDGDIGLPLSVCVCVCVCCMDACVLLANIMLVALCVCAADLSVLVQLRSCGLSPIQQSLAQFVHSQCHCPALTILTYACVPCKSICLLAV